jgi:uncharacterized protein (TIGR03086 family)
MHMLTNLPEDQGVVRDIRELDRRAVLASVGVVSRVTVADLSRATPCSEWTLGDLLAHMVAQHHGFAASSAGRGTDPAVWSAPPLGDDPASVYARAADRVLAAFAEDAVLTREFALPEISSAQTFPGAQAVSFHFIDYVVHAWDVARSLGAGYSLDPELAQPALLVAQRVPDGERRLVAGAAFRPGLPAPGDAEPLDQILALLGRSPNWPA